MGDYVEKFLQWQNYAHYLLLTVGLFLWHALSYTSQVEASGNYFNMFWWYALGLFVIDSIVHLIFWIAPHPIRWRD